MLTVIALSAGLILAAYAGVGVPYDRLEVKPDPKKKKTGDECKSSEECQQHHRCGKADAKKRCIASQPIDLPST
jgi:hypothetical protein